jgi:EAL domain-containing protein (putative c-di-GMP-specific phosphodiesterase class I)
MRQLRILVYRPGETEPKTRISVNLALARLASKILPRKIREDIEKEGVDLNEVLSVIAKENVRGKLIEIEKANERIVISVE